MQSHTWTKANLDNKAILLEITILRYIKGTVKEK